MFLVFDVDGTIMETEDRYFAIMVEAIRREVGEEEAERISKFMKTKEFEKMYGMGDREIMFSLLGDGPSAERAYELYLKLSWENIKEIINKEAFVPGFLDFLSSVDDEFCLVSSSHRRVIDYLVSLLPREPSFTVTNEDVARHKPDPEPYLVAKKRMAELSYSEGLVFEDAVAGRESALRAGFDKVVCIRTCLWEPCFRDWFEVLEAWPRIL